MTATIHLDTTQLDRILARIGTTREKVIEGLAFEVERRAKQNAPVLTGSLRASIHTRTKGGGTTPSTPTNGAAMVDIPSPAGRIVAIVGTGVEYAAFVELGTSKMAAQPFLGPAVESVAEKLNSGETYEEMFK